MADTSTIQETGQQTLSYQVYFQDDIQRSKISVDHASAYSVTVTVGEMDSKTVPIRCDIVGSTAKGFTAGELTLDPAELNLRGQRDDLLNIAYAKVTLDISGATAPWFRPWSGSCMTITTSRSTTLPSAPR